MKKAIIGKKVGMTQIFDEAGKVIPVTVIQAGPCTVVQKKTVETDGYEAVQVGFGALTGGLLLALGSVDGIHGVLDLRTRIDGSDQRLDHSETEAGHFVADGLLYVKSHIVLTGEGIVQRQCRNGGIGRRVRFRSV